MKTVLDKADTRGYADHGWLKTYHTFSFANYYNPQRVHFGALRVLNDDTVEALQGFGMHQHKNMEVISIPLKGYLRHGDSIQNSEVITPGDIQIMSAGSGIYHSEYNDSSTEDLQFLQIWVFPKEENTEPYYKSFDVRASIKRNEFSFIIAPDGSAPTSIKQDAWFSLTHWDKGEDSIYKLHNEKNGVYAFVIEGAVDIEHIRLSTRDGAGFYETDSLFFRFAKETYLLLMEVPMI